MDHKTSPTATTPASLLRRLWPVQTAQVQHDNPDVDLGYESALPWFSTMDNGKLQAPAAALPSDSSA